MIDNNEAIEIAHRASIRIAITFHFLEARLQYLEYVLARIATFPVLNRNIAVFVNAIGPEEEKLIKEVFERAKLNEGVDVQIFKIADLEHPYHLAWSHKSLIVNEFLALEPHYSHFIYLEDDEELTFENFVYFIWARAALKNMGLLPGMLRTEWNETKNTEVALDSQHQHNLALSHYFVVDGYAFIVMNNPYWGAFILDAELAKEYICSQSFEMNQSRRKRRWGVRERSAMALSFENVPAPFESRVVVPVSLTHACAPRFCWLKHLPNNYVNGPSLHAKIPMNDLFVGKIRLRNNVIAKRPLLVRALHRLKKKLASGRY